MAKLVCILNIGVVGVVILISLLALHGSVRLLAIGSLCAALTVGMYAAPMAAMRIVVKTKSVEFMPFSLSFFLFLNGGVWSIYAALVRDFFIGVPNAIGFVLGSAQLLLYAVYRRKTVSPKEEGLDDEVGSAHLVAHMEVEMGSKARHLSKGSSLPKPSVSRQHSLTEIVKSLSLTPYELSSVWNQKDHSGDEEDGEQNYYRKA